MADNDFNWIKETAEDFQPLFRRMDADADLNNQLEYQLRDLETKELSKNVVNLTMNDARVYADKVQAFMNDATSQALVEGKHLSDKETTLIENFDTDMQYEIDTRLLTRDISSLKSFEIEQSCIRGTVASRYVSWEKDEQFVPDLLPCDSRFLVYEHGDRDLERAACKSVRSKASILQKYPKADFPGSAKRGGIWEEWTKDFCRIWLSNPDEMAENGQLLTQYENVFGYVPFIIQGVGAGSMLQDKNSRAHRFESIFANNRLLYEHLNMLGSILQTLNYMTFNRVHLWESDAGTLAKNPPRPGSRKTISIDKGTRGLFPMDVADIKNATRLFYALLLGAIQRGSLSNIDYGNLTFPLSAVAISKLTSQRDNVIGPRLQAIGWFYRKLHYMMRDQYVKGGYQAEIGEPGLERTYNASDLDKKCKITYQFFAISPEQDIANHAVAQQALAEGLPRRHVYANILHERNPEGLIMEGRAEKVEQLDPVIALFRYGHALIEQGTEESFLEADLVAMKIDNLLMQPQVAPETKQAPMNARSLVPLLEGGGGRGSPMSEDEGMMNAPEEMLQREERRAEVVRKSEAE